MIWEPFYNREYSVTDLDDIAEAYHLMVKVSNHNSYSYDHPPFEIHMLIVSLLVSTRKKRWQNLSTTIWWMLFANNIKTSLQKLFVFSVLIFVSVCLSQMSLPS